MACCGEKVRAEEGAWLACGGAVKAAGSLVCSWLLVGTLMCLGSAGLRFVVWLVRCRQVDTCSCDFSGEGVVHLGGFYRSPGVAGRPTVGQVGSWELTRW